MWGDGMVYYFFPQPDSDYIFNAIACAQELKAEVRENQQKVATAQRIG